MLRGILARLRVLFRREAVEGELAEELSFHLEQDARRNRARGLSPEDARLAARRSFGNLGQVRESAREALRWVPLDRLGQDLRYAFRVLRRNPGFTAAAVLSLGLGIGATTVAFSALDGVLLRRLPVPEPGRLFYLRERTPPARVNDELAWPLYTQLRDGSRTLADLAAMNVFDRSSLAIGGAGGGVDPARARVALISGNYFVTLGVTAGVGRTITQDDDGALLGNPVAVISDGYWARRLARAHDVVGRALTLNGTTFTIIGVMPKGFAGDWVGRPVDVWIPFSMHQRVLVEIPYALIRPNDSFLHLVGRLRPGATRAQAVATIQVIYQRVLRDGAGPGASEEALRQIAQRRLDAITGAHGYSTQREALVEPLTIFAVVVAVVLLIACGNVASLLLARAAARQREMAMRLAIGAGRRRLTRQVLTESVLLAVLAGALGSLLALWGARALATTMAAGPVQMFFGRSSWIVFDAGVSARTLVFTLGLSLLTGVLFGLAPAVRAPKVALASALSGRGAASGGRRGGRFGVGRVLVVGQVALSMVVLITAGLLVRTLRNLESQELGFSRDRLLLVWTQPSATGRDTVQLRELWHTVQERLSVLPGVVGASASNQGLLNGSMPTANPPSNPMQVEGEPPRPTTAPMFRTFVTPRFFETMGIPLLLGRDFTEQDNDSAPPRIIINQSMARHYFDRRSPVGRRIHLGSQDTVGKEIIGVVGDFISGTPRAGRHQELLWYLSYRDRDSVRRLQVMMIALRTEGDPAGLAGRVREELVRADPTLPILKIDTVDEQLGDVLAQDRLIAGLASFFGLIALVLACLGLYGVIAYTTARRTSEIGMRMALGATRGVVLGMVLRESIVLVFAGLALGVPATLLATRLVASRLFGVAAADPTTMVAMMFLLLAVGSLAGFLPARRAARVDPMVALRVE